MTVELIHANFTCCTGVSGVCSCRQGGESLAPYNGLNLGLHVGDDSTRVEKNRVLLASSLPGIKQISWLNQVHSCKVVEIHTADDVLKIQDADAQITSLSGVGLAIMTADCLPVLFAAKDGSVIGAAHGGWRGLYGGIISETIKSMNCSPFQIRAWLGPCIGPTDYEIGEDLYQSFLQKNCQYAKCFKPSRPGHWFADLQAIALCELEMVGIASVNRCRLSTFSSPSLFYSYRREKVTGRMASVVYKFSQF